MARVKIMLTCTKCGKEFERIHTCNNSAGASSYTEWAKDNITICPDCYYAAKRAKEQATLENYMEGYHLPEITGVSDKQIAFADKLRTSFMADLFRLKIDLSRCFRLADAIQFDKASDAGRAKMAELAQQSGQTVEAWFSDYRHMKIAHDMGRIDKALVGKIETVFAESNASKIIDALK